MTENEVAIGRNGSPFRVGDEVVRNNAPVWTVVRIDRYRQDDALVTITRVTNESEQRLWGVAVLTELVPAVTLYRVGTDRTPVLQCS